MSSMPSTKLTPHVPQVMTHSSVLVWPVRGPSCVCCSMVAVRRSSFRFCIVIHSLTLSGYLVLVLLQYHAPCARRKGHSQDLLSAVDAVVFLGQPHLNLVALLAGVRLLALLPDHLVVTAQVRRVVRLGDQRPAVRLRVVLDRVVRAHVQVGAVLAPLAVEDDPGQAQLSVALLRGLLDQGLHLVQRVHELDVGCRVDHGVLLGVRRCATKLPRARGGPQPPSRVYTIRSRGPGAGSPGRGRPPRSPPR